MAAAALIHKLDGWTTIIHGSPDTFYFKSLLLVCEAARPLAASADNEPQEYVEIIKTRCDMPPPPHALKRFMLFLPWYVNFEPNIRLTKIKRIFFQESVTAACQPCVIYTGSNLLCDLWHARFHFALVQVKFKMIISTKFEDEDHLFRNHCFDIVLNLFSVLQRIYFY